MYLLYWDHIADEFKNLSIILEDYVPDKICVCENATTKTTLRWASWACFTFISKLFPNYFHYIRIIKFLFFFEKDLKLLKLAYELKFAFPQSKILSMSCRRLKVACRGLYLIKNIFQNSEKFGNSFTKNNVIYVNLLYIHYLKPNENCFIKIHHSYFNDFNIHFKIVRHWKKYIFYNSLSFMIVKKHAKTRVTSNK